MVRWLWGPYVTARGAYIHIGIMLAVAAMKLSLDWNVVEDFGWRLFWAIAAAGWAVGLVTWARDEDTPVGRVARNGGVALATFMVLGLGLL